MACDNMRSIDSMNFSHLIDREEAVSGLAITDSHVRLAYYKKTKGTKGESLALIAEPFPPGTLKEGAVADSQALSRAISKALVRAEGAVSYCIVSLPPERIYSKILSFPQALPLERLDEAVRLALNFQLPFASETVYLDYERLPAKESTEVFLAACPREIVDGYLAVFKAVGVKAVAMESHLMSVGRTQKDKECLLVAVPSEQSVAIAVFDTGYVRFSRTVPASRIPTPAALAEELRKVHDFCVTEWNISLQEKKWGDLTAGIPQTQDAEWLSSIGALARGRLDREKDALVSLLPVGTEQAYAYQKAMVFSVFLQNAIIGVALFFTVAYVAAFFVMLSVKQRFTQEFASISLSPASAQVLAQEKQALQFNALLQTTGGLVRQSPQWSSFVTLIKSSVGEGIVISNMTIGAPSDAVQLSGVASSRAQLSAFKKTLEGMPAITEIALPLTNLTLKTNIPFSVSFKLRDPASVLPR